MKKKLIAILLAATCALTAGLTGCSGNAATSGTDESKTSDAQSTGDSSKESTGDNTSKNDVVAGFVYIGKINDGGYTQAHDAGRLAVEKLILELRQDVLLKRPLLRVKAYHCFDEPESKLLVHIVIFQPSRSHERAILTDHAVDAPKICFHNGVALSD